NMLIKAENAYKRNVTNGFTGRKNGVAVMMSNQEVFHNGRFEWHKRMVEPGDMRAAANGIAKIKRRQERLDYLRDRSQHYLGKTLTQWLENRMTTLNNNLERILPTSLSKYIQAITFQGVAKIEAVAYYGEVAEEIPNIKSLGYFAKQNHGGPNTLVISIEKQNGKDTIQVRTIQDYMSEIYVSATDKPALPQD
ncbi:MAG: hypothetical protein K2X66_02215, partial [Cyanobacteria bacterium]|nr:hypothetical protein [Cyanobacteriota bacterium]